MLIFITSDKISSNLIFPEWIQSWMYKLCLTTKDIFHTFKAPEVFNLVLESMSHYPSKL